jgi:hypothetical protein
MSLLATAGGRALAAAVVALALWPFSYAWVAVSLMGGGDPAWLSPFTIVTEMGAVALGAAAALAGVFVRRGAAPGSVDRRRAGAAIALGSLAAALVVVPNLLFTFVL